MNCNAKYDKKERIFRCKKCNGILEVTYDYSSLPKKLPKGRITHSKYKQLMPVKKLLSLGEGGTELKKADLGGMFEELSALYLKIETENPTRTFKDRGSSVEISRAKELGYRSVCCASTGNMGLSIAKYARKHKMKCTIFISIDANEEKIAKIKAQKAKVIETKGDFNFSLEKAEQFALANKKTFLCGDYHYRKEGQKSLIFEILEQLNFKVPDYVFVQVGNATLLAAVYKGLRELKMMRLISKMPKLIAVQSKQCDPLVRAFITSSSIRYIRPETAADAIAVGYPTFGFEGIKALHATEGYAVGVSDNEIELAKDTLYRYANIKSELGGATGLAGLIEVYKRNAMLFRNKQAVVIITGNNED